MVKISCNNIYLFCLGVAVGGAGGGAGGGRYIVQMQHPPGKV